MSRLLYSSAFVLLTLLFNGQTTGPGGVGTSASNVMWLDANRGITLTGTTVTNWADQSGNAFNAVPSSATARPGFVSAAVNGYPCLDFDGTNDELWVNDNAALDLTQWHFFIVPRVALQKDYNAWLTKGNDGSENFELLSFSDGNIHAPILYTDASRTFPSSASGQVTTTEFNIIEYSYTSSVGRDVYKNGSSIISDNENKTPSTNNFSLYIGNEKTTSRFINGDMAEVIMYNAPLNSAQRIIVNNYLAAKYNVTLSSNDVYTQDNAGNGNYDHQVSGIGRVNSSNIHNDSKGQGIVRILNPTGLGDNEFYMWGHDNGALGSYPPGDFPSSQGVQGRLVRVWRGSEVGSITNFEVRFDLTGLGSVTASQLRLLIDTNNDGLFADETTAGGGVIGSAVTLGGNVYGFTNVTGLNDGIRFTLGTTSAGSTPLPIELSEFKGHFADKQVALEWVTASEKSNDHFLVTRSKDGITFENIGKVQAVSNSTSRNEYSFVDVRPPSGLVYYRLKQIDKDGSFSYSPLVDVSVPFENYHLILLPNPSNGAVEVDLSVFVNQKVTVTIKGMSGKEIESETTFVKPEETKLSINRQLRLNPGIYLVVISTESGSYHAKLIIR